MVGPILAPDAEATARPAAAPQPLRFLAAPSRRTCRSSVSCNLPLFLCITDIEVEKWEWRHASMLAIPALMRSRSIQGTKSVFSY